MARADTYDPEDCATVWFARLERAKRDNDFELAAEAIRQLRRLGVEVRFRTPTRPVGGNVG